MMLWDGPFSMLPVRRRIQNRAGFTAYTRKSMLADAGEQDPQRRETRSCVHEERRRAQEGSILAKG